VRLSLWPFFEEVMDYYILADVFLIIWGEGEELLLIAIALEEYCFAGICMDTGL
jgi:hypothetical protein